MPYRLDIPGQVSEYQLKAIELVASLVPENGSVVEVGSLFGRSSWAWAKSVPTGCRVHCIDPWQGNEGIRNMEAQYGVKYGLEQFQAYTADCPNIVPMQGYSPQNFGEWNSEIDLYYEDAVHTDPIFSQNLSLWASRLKPTGIACGDDHRPRFKDIINGVARKAAEMGRTLITVDFFWCLLPSDELLPGARAVATQLIELSAACERDHRAQGVGINIGPLKPFREAPVGQAKMLDIRLYSAGLDPWPLEDSDLRVGVRIFDDSGEMLSLNEGPLPARVLTYDIPHDVAVALDTANLSPGDYQVSYDIFGAGGWLHKGKSRKHAFKVVV